MLVRKAFHIRTYTGLRPHVKTLMSGRAAKVQNKKTSHKKWNVLGMVWE